MTSVKQVDVVVIGAGVSGLVSAYELQKLTNQATEVIVLEANDRIGGRTYGKILPCAGGEEEWDLGGQWVCSSQHYVMKLLDEFNIETYPQYTKGIKKLLVNTPSDVRSYTGLIPSFNVFELLDINRFLNKVNSMASQIPLGSPLDCRSAAKWDEQNLKSFVDATCFSSNCKKLVSLTSQAVLGVETSQISLFYFLYYCALSGGFDMLVDTKRGAAQEFRVKGTASKLAYKLQERIGADRVFCGDPVKSITQNNDSVIVKTLHGKEYQAKYIVCAIPPHLVNQIHFEPPLPLNRVQLGMRMPMGNMIKCIATYRTTFWKTNGLSAEATLIFEQPSIGPIGFTYDATSSCGNPAIIAFMGGEHAIYWSQKSQNERKAAVIECLVTLFGKEAETDLIHYEDKDWSKEPYTGGCPVGVMQPGCLVYFHHALREPFNRIHWAGTETATRWCGYIDGAVESGLRSAKEVAGRLSSDVVTSNGRLETPSPIFCAGGKLQNAMIGGKTKNILKQYFPGLVFVCVVSSVSYCLYKKFQSK